MTATLYCSQCHWSTKVSPNYPPFLYCVLHGKVIEADEDVCKDYVKPTTQINQTRSEE